MERTNSEWGNLLLKSFTNPDIEDYRYLRTRYDGLIEPTIKVDELLDRWSFTIRKGLFTNMCEIYDDFTKNKYGEEVRCESYEKLKSVIAGSLATNEDRYAMRMELMVFFVRVGADKRWIEEPIAKYGTSTDIIDYLISIGMKVDSSMIETATKHNQWIVSDHFERIICKQ